MIEWLGQYWLQVAGTILSAGALFVAWRNWVRSRSVVTAEIGPLTEQEKWRGDVRDVQLTLPVTSRARRNSAYIADTFLVAGKDRIRGSTIGGQRADVQLRVGRRTYRYWYRSGVRHLNPRKAWRIYWQDSEGRLHRAGKVIQEDIRRLTTAEE